MKAALLAPVITLLITQALWAEQVAPPAPVPGAKGKSERIEAEILKVYALDDQGAKFRAYAVKYKGTEVIASDMLAMTDKKVGDKITVLVVRAEAPLGAGKIQTMMFQVFDPAAFRPGLPMK